MKNNNYRLFIALAFFFLMAAQFAAAQEKEIFSPYINVISYQAYSTLMPDGREHTPIRDGSRRTGFEVGLDLPMSPSLYLTTGYRFTTVWYQITDRRTFWIFGQEHWVHGVPVQVSWKKSLKQDLFKLKLTCGPIAHVQKASVPPTTTSSFFAVGGLFTGRMDAPGHKRRGFAGASLDGSATISANVSKSFSIQIGVGANVGLNQHSTSTYTMFSGSSVAASGVLASHGSYAYASLGIRYNFFPSAKKIL